LLENNIIRKKTLGIKLLWNWTIESKVTVHVDSASASAKEAVEKAWGELVLK
jgi:ribosomal protein L15